MKTCKNCGIAMKGRLSKLYCSPKCQRQFYNLGKSVKNPFADLKAKCSKCKTEKITAYLNKKGLCERCFFSEKKKLIVGKFARRKKE